MSYLARLERRFATTADRYLSLLLIMRNSMAMRNADHWMRYRDQERFLYEKTRGLFALLGELSTRESSSFSSVSPDSSTRYACLISARKQLIASLKQEARRLKDEIHSLHTSPSLPSRREESASLIDLLT